MFTGIGVLVALVAVMSADDNRQTATPAGPVVFICEHGSVKSLIAREWFDRLAAERGLSIRATSRGVTPDAAVPDVIVAALREDGFDVQGFTPARVDAAALAPASRIVAIGLDPGVLPVSSSTVVETWTAIPPATEKYEAARDAIKARIEELLKSLAAEAR